MEEEEKPHSNDGQEKNVKQIKRSSIQTSQKDSLEDNNTDWISRLPDSLLLRILSRFKLEEVMRTSLLSTRWRYLWTSFHSLDFEFWKISKKIEFINWVLFHHDESKVDNLRIQIKYKEKHAHLVDSWILFAARHGVEKLKLDLFDGKSPEVIISSDYTFYKLPHSLFRCGLLTCLELYGCELNLPATFQLTSLEILYLKYIDLDPFAIEHFTSNCPHLEHLYLNSCNKSIDLNICITNDKIRDLTISEDEDYELDNGITTNINAPNLFLLSFYGLPRTNYHFQQLSSLLAVDFSLVSAKHHAQDVLYGEDTGCDFTQLLHDLRYVKRFRFDTMFIQALTAKEIQGLDPMSINATCICISSVLTKWELPGIAYLLKSASYLERLVISCELGRPESVLDLTDEFLEENDFEEKDFWKLRELDSLSILQNTKTIEINVWQYGSLVNDYKNCEKLLEFVRFLLKTSKVLERMTIKTFGRRENKDELMHEVTRKTPPLSLPSFCLYIEGGELMVKPIGSGGFEGINMSIR